MNKVWDPQNKGLKLKEEIKEKEKPIIKLVQTNSSKSSDTNTLQSNLAKKRASAFIKLDRKAFLSPNGKSRRNSQFFQSVNASMMIPNNNDVSVLGGEYSDVSMLYWNETKKQKDETPTKRLSKEMPVRMEEQQSFKNKYDITFEPKYSMNNNPNHKIIVKENWLENGVKERIFKSGVIERVYPKIKKERIFPDGYSITYFINGNVIQVYPFKEKIVKYDKELKFTKTIFDNGLVTIKDNTKLVKFYKDGRQIMSIKLFFIFITI